MDAQDDAAAQPAEGAASPTVAADRPRRAPRPVQPTLDAGEDGAPAKGHNGSACIACRDTKRKCDGKRPCDRCVRMGCACEDSEVTLRWTRRRSGTTRLIASPEARRAGAGTGPGRTGGFLLKEGVAADAGSRRAGGAAEERGRSGAGKADNADLGDGPPAAGNRREAEMGAAEASSRTPKPRPRARVESRKRERSVSPLPVSTAIPLELGVGLMDLGSVRVDDPVATGLFSRLWSASLTGIGNLRLESQLKSLIFARRGLYIPPEDVDDRFDIRTSSPVPIWRSADAGATAHDEAVVIPSSLPWADWCIANTTSDAWSAAVREVDALVERAVSTCPVATVRLTYDWGCGSPTGVFLNDEASRLFGVTREVLMQRIRRGEEIVWMHPSTLINRALMSMRARMNGIRSFVFDGVYIRAISEPSVVDGSLEERLVTFSASEIVNIDFFPGSSSMHAVTVYFTNVRFTHQPVDPTRVLHELRSCSAEIVSHPENFEEVRALIPVLATAAPSRVLMPEVCDLMKTRFLERKLKWEEQIRTQQKLADQYLRSRGAPAGAADTPPSSPTATAQSTPSPSVGIVSSAAPLVLSVSSQGARRSAHAEESVNVARVTHVTHALDDAVVDLSVELARSPSEERVEAGARSRPRADRAEAIDPGTRAWGDERHAQAMDEIIAETRRLDLTPLVHDVGHPVSQDPRHFPSTAIPSSTAVLTHAGALGRRESGASQPVALRFAAGARGEDHGGLVRFTDSFTLAPSSSSSSSSSSSPSSSSSSSFATAVEPYSSFASTSMAASPTGSQALSCSTGIPADEPAILWMKMQILRMSKSFMHVRDAERFLYTTDTPAFRSMDVALWTAYQAKEGQRRHELEASPDALFRKSIARVPPSSSASSASSASSSCEAGDLDIAALVTTGSAPAMFEPQEYPSLPHHLPSPPPLPASLLPLPVSLPVALASTSACHTTPATAAVLGFEPDAALRPLTHTRILDEEMPSHQRRGRSTEAEDTVRVQDDSASASSSSSTSSSSSGSSMSSWLRALLPTHQNAMTGSHFEPSLDESGRSGLLPRQVSRSHPSSGQDSGAASPTFEPLQAEFPGTTGTQTIPLALALAPIASSACSVFDADPSTGRQFSAPDTSAVPTAMIALDAPLAALGGEARLWLPMTGAENVVSELGAMAVHSPLSPLGSTTGSVSALSEVGAPSHGERPTADRRLPCAGAASNTVRLSCSPGWGAGFPAAAAPASSTTTFASTAAATTTSFPSGSSATSASCAVPQPSSTGHTIPLFQSSLSPRGGVREPQLTLAESERRLVTVFHRLRSQGCPLSVADADERSEWPTSGFSPTSSLLLGAGSSPRPSVDLLADLREASTLLVSVLEPTSREADARRQIVLPPVFESFQDIRAHAPAYRSILVDHIEAVERALRSGPKGLAPTSPPLRLGEEAVAPAPAVVEMHSASDAEHFPPVDRAWWAETGDIDRLLDWT